jgi:phage anti-repressor protein
VNHVNQFEGENEMIPFEKLELIAKSPEQFPVDFDEAWQWLGYSRKDHALETLKANFEETVEFSSIKRKTSHASNSHNLDSPDLAGKSSYGGKRQGAGRPEKKYFLSTDCFKAFCMMAGTEQGKTVRRYYLELEKRYWAIVQNARAMKIARRDLTDAIRISGLDEAMHGFAYKQFTDLIYKAVLGMNARKYRAANGLPKDAVIRESVTPVQRAGIAKLEKWIASSIELGADYQKVKDIVVDMGTGLPSGGGAV